MRKWLAGWLMAWACVAVGFAQDSALVAENVALVTRLNAFGQEVWVVEGDLVNTSSETAYTRVQMFADVLDEDGEVVGEAFGYLVNTCGFALIDDPLQPMTRRTFALSVDLYEDATPASVVLFPQGQATEPEAERPPLHPAITPISEREVVSAEWRDGALLYGVGCDERVFLTYDWYSYDENTATSTRLENHPDAGLVNELFIRITRLNRLPSGEEDSTLITRSALSFSPYSRRVFYQDAINNVYTADEINPSDRSLIHTILHQYTLKGVQWTQDDNFLAYYFGAYGEPVRYITGRGRGQLISQVLTRNTPSNTVPAPQYDGQRVLISGTFDGTTGYYLQATQSPQRELLFEITPEELAGNHYPAPVYYRKDISNRFFYIIRPIDGVATLQCYHCEAKTLHTLTPLPLQLATDERAWAWLNADNTRLAVGAKGRHSGLWLVDLTAFEACR
jgi:hypothetical protein